MNVMHISIAMQKKNLAVCPDTSMYVRRTHVLYDHHEERELDAQSFLRVSRARDECGANIGAHDLKHRRVYVLIRNAFNVPISHCMQRTSKMMHAVA
jgi:hypothetical protein